VEALADTIGLRALGLGAWGAGGPDRLRDVVLSARRTRGGADDRNVRRRVPPLHGANRTHLAGGLLGAGRRCAAMHVSDRGSTRPFHVQCATVVSCHAAQGGSDACVRREPRPSRLWGRG
jgi:hypothetical protein